MMFGEPTTYSSFTLSVAMSQSNNICTFISDGLGEEMKLEWVLPTEKIYANDRTSLEEIFNDTTESPKNTYK